MPRVVGDVRDAERVAGAAFDASAHRRSSFHLAAQPLVRRRYAEPVETFATNVMGTVNVLEARAARAAGAAVVVVTSDKCYGPRAGAAVTRRTTRSAATTRTARARLRPSWWPRRTGRVVLRPDVPARSRPRVRATSSAAATGPTTASCRTPSARCRAASRSLSATRDAVRPWQHVLDAARRLSARAPSRLCADAGDVHGEAWNFGRTRRTAGPGRPSSWTLVPQPGARARRWTPEADAGPHEARSALDAARRAARAGLAAAAGLREGVERTVDWYRASLSEARPGRDAALSERSRSRRLRGRPRRERDRASGCRGCGGAPRRVVPGPRRQPLANALRRARRRWTHASRASRSHVSPLRRCHLVQLERDRGARGALRATTSTSRPFSDTLLAPRARRCRRADRGASSSAPSRRVVEVASNDGYLLQYFTGARHPGARDRAGAERRRGRARERGIPTLVRFFGAELASRAARRGRRRRPHRRQQRARARARPQRLRRRRRGAAGRRRRRRLRVPVPAAT